MTGWGAHLGSYLHWSEYGAPDEDAEARRALVPELVEQLARKYGRQHLVAQLAVLNDAERRSERLTAITEGYRATLSPAARLRFDEAMADTSKGARRMLARHPILATIGLVIQADAPWNRDLSNASELIKEAIWLTHAVGETLDASVDDDGTRVAGWPSYLLMETVRLGPLYDPGDDYAAIARTWSLWNEYGPRISRYPLRKPPRELLSEATGAELETLLGFGFAALAHMLKWTPDQPLYLRRDMGSGVPPKEREPALEFIAAEPATLQDEFRQGPDRFDILPLQVYPVLDTEAGLLVLDQGFLLDRVTKGLYWPVHDHEKELGTGLDGRWRQAFGEMVELMVEDSLKVMAPPLLGGKGKTFFTEEELQDAYGGQACDMVVFVGSHYLLVEVVSGQLSVPSRIGGSLEKFEEDTRHLVIEKCEQIDSVCESLLRDESRLTGFPSTPNVRLLPVVAIGGGYPVNSPALDYVEDLVAQAGLFRDPRVEPLAIVDLSEIEALEGLAERGRQPQDVILAWEQSDQSQLPLRWYVAEHLGGFGHSSRPARMRELMDGVWPRILKQLQLSRDS